MLCWNHYGYLCCVFIALFAYLPLLFFPTWDSVSGTSHRRRALMRLLAAHRISSSTDRGGHGCIIFVLLHILHERVTRTQLRVTDGKQAFWCLQLWYLDERNYGIPYLNRASKEVMKEIMIEVKYRQNTIRWPNFQTTNGQQIIYLITCKTKNIITSPRVNAYNKVEDYHVPTEHEI